MRTVRSQRTLHLLPKVPPAPEDEARAVRYIRRDQLRIFFSLILAGTCYKVLMKPTPQESEIKWHQEQSSLL